MRRASPRFRQMAKKYALTAFRRALFLLSLSSALARSLQRDSDLVKLDTREATPSKSRTDTAAVAGFLAKKRQARPFIYSSRMVFGQQRLNHETLVQFADACAVCAPFLASNDLARGGADNSLDQPKRLVPCLSCTAWGSSSRATASCGARCRSGCTRQAAP